MNWTERSVHFSWQRLKYKITICACANVPEVFNDGQSSIVTLQSAKNDLTAQHQKENVTAFDIRPAETELTNHINNVPLPGAASMSVEACVQKSKTQYYNIHSLWKYSGNSQQTCCSGEKNTEKNA